MRSKCDGILMAFKSFAGAGDSDLFRVILPYGSCFDH